ncbi:MAG: hypothetical protein MRZ65_08670 [Lachnospiraceae bacterium]|nr:hypothetical protein [Lachnospiraceae bacterium]
MMQMGEHRDFKEVVQGRKIPICVLDQKWHKLFALKGKPDEVVEKEKELNVLLQKQGKLNTENKDLKKVKSRLMENIVQNMEGTNEDKSDHVSSKMLDEDRRLIDEVNQQIEDNEDQLLELPREISRVNQELMVLTMDYCYEKLRINISEAKQINEWITQVRIDLKKNIIKKQNREINSRQIYAYMHDIFGAELMDVFDLENDDMDLSVLESSPKKKAENKQENDG